MTAEAKTCCHCGKPIGLADSARWEVSQSSRFHMGEKWSRVVHEHLACAIKADRPLPKAAYDAIFEAERSGVA